MNESHPLVSVICLSHNHERFVQAAIESVEQQTYDHIELILVDDGSSDGSKEIMEKIAREKGYHFINNEESKGNCAAFNSAFSASEGCFIIDLAADDKLEPDRIAKGLEAFANSAVGVHFCDVSFIDKDDRELGSHFKRDASGMLVQKVPTGNVYQDLIQHYFICPPSMMIRRDVLEELGGYDESLSFEDFDFWIRSSRNWLYAYTDEILVKKRILSNSLSQQQKAFRNKHQRSILAVCRKIKTLNKTTEEHSALKKRCIYEIKQCLKYGNIELIPAFLKLLFRA